jgi:hypothetical protein
LTDLKNAAKSYFLVFFSFFSKNEGQKTSCLEHGKTRANFGHFDSGLHQSIEHGELGRLVKFQLFSVSSHGLKEKSSQRIFGGVRFFCDF